MQHPPDYFAQMNKLLEDQETVFKRSMALVEAARFGRFDVDAFDGHSADLRQIWARMDDLATADLGVSA